MNGALRLTSLAFIVHLVPDISDARIFAHPAAFLKRSSLTTRLRRPISYKTPLSSTQTISTRALGGVPFLAAILENRQALLLIISAHDRDRGGPRGPTPPTPPCVRVRTRRFGSVTRLC